MPSATNPQDRDDSPHSQSYTQDIFAKIDKDFHDLLEDFRLVLREAGEKDLAKALPWHGAQSKGFMPMLNPNQEIHCLSIAFQLLNLVEENAALQARRGREATSLDTGESGLWPRTLKELREADFTPTEIADFLADIEVEPVLTAHPTEAKPPTVLKIHRYLYLLLLELENRMWTRAERAEIHRKIRATLERLWRTGEIMLRKPDLGSELENVLYYLSEVFPNVLARLDLRLREAWTEAGFDPELIRLPERLPRLTFGDWVGGDRDGHPLVTAEVTRKTLGRLRATAIELLEHQFQHLSDIMSLSEMLKPAPASFRQAIDRQAQKLGDAAEEIRRTYPQEPWRQYVALMHRRLQATGQGAPGGFASSEEVMADLTVLRKSLEEIGAGRLARHDVVPVFRSVQVFGLHMAAVDIRQNSEFHDRALTQLLLSAGIKGGDFAEWSEDRRVAFLNKELESSRPLAPRRAKLGVEATAVLESYQVLSDHYDQHSAEGLGSLIISMTRNLSDLLVVYTLAREAGLVRQDDAGMACLMPVVPLFETIEDLENAPGILDAFLSHHVTKRSLALQGVAKPVQQVMIGYSDSNKDGGIFASQWCLHKAQAALAEVAEKHHVRLQFFHGRGGTPSRGSGPTHRFLEALPPGSLHGVFRVTEQGETIAQKYGNIGTATYNLELLMAGVVSETLKNKKRENTREDLSEVMDLVASYTKEGYQSILRRDGFLTYWSQATPIDALEQSRIGSRPSRRKGQRTLEDLRAIPWVFSWNQARHYLPGWYGTGTGLKRLRDENPDAWDILQRQAPKDPFLRNVFFNAETSLASAHPELMGEYASLVAEESVRNEYYDNILREYKLTDEMIDELFQKPRSERRPRMLFTIQRREEGLRRLHRRQIALLRDWRKRQRDGDEKGAEELLPTLLLSINAIASGLRTTG